MPTTRKKVIKTVYKDEDDSEEAGDFSDSGSDAVISHQSSSEDDDVPEFNDSSEEEKKKNKSSKSRTVKKPRFTKAFISKVSRQPVSKANADEDDSYPKEPVFSVKDLTDADKLLPSFLNLSESDSSDEDEAPTVSSKPLHVQNTNTENEKDEMETEYKDVWSNNLEQSEEIAKRTFMELERHKSQLEETKQSIQQYTVKHDKTKDTDVNDLLALGEEVLPSVSPAPTKVKKKKGGKIRHDSDSEMEDWEEVAESKIMPQQGLQLIVDFPGAVSRKAKKPDVEMMMRRKINRVKKEYQVYMHKVHVLCWLGHGNYVSQVLNNQDVMKAALSMVPSTTCYPGERVDMKYVEQITTWFKDKLTIKEDRNEGKFRPKAPPLKDILLDQIKRRVVTSKKYFVFIFVSMLRALGLQCRVMLNFTTLPIKPPSTELCSLSTKPKVNESGKDDKQGKECNTKNRKKSTGAKNIPQLDGIYDSSSDSDLDNIMQLDGNDDNPPIKQKKTPVKGKTKMENNNVEDVSPPKRMRRNLSIRKCNSGSIKNSDTGNKDATVSSINKEVKSEPVVRKITRKTLSLNKNISNAKNNEDANENKTEEEQKDKIFASGTVVQKVTRKSLSLNKNASKNTINENKNVKNTEQEEAVKDLTSTTVRKTTRKKLALNKNVSKTPSCNETNENIVEEVNMKSAASKKLPKAKTAKKDETEHNVNKDKKFKPESIVADVDNVANISSEYFNTGESSANKREVRARKRSHTSNPQDTIKNVKESKENECKKPRTKSAPGIAVNKSKYFKDKTDDHDNKTKIAKSPSRKVKAKENDADDSERISHRDLAKTKTKPKNDVTNDLVNIIKKRVREAKVENKTGRTNKSSDEDSDYLPEIDEDAELKPSTSKKSNVKPGKSRKIDRRILSTDDEAPSKKVDIWCEIFVEELEQWVAVDVIKGRVHCVNEIYSGATHPVNYVIGWDNNNYLKDLTRRYVPQWNTVTRKQRVEPSWWNKAIQPWTGPRTPRDREEDECLDRMQLDAPLPKSIAEYKNHPLYALKRHLLKYEAIYPPDAATLGFVRGEPVYARECVYVCRSRDTWLKEAKVVKLGEKPYKVVKARPKWDRLSNKLITDKPLEIFGPWQVQDYEPPTAENGIVPRNAYGNVELFKDCMLPKGTVHIKLPGLHRVAKKLNIDCAPAMTGFDFNGGWSHPVFDGFVVCKEFEDIIISAWEEDQEEQERKEQEKMETRVYGNWRRLIKGLLIRERLKLKYGFTEPTTSQDNKKKATGPRLTVKKRF